MAIQHPYMRPSRKASLRAALGLIALAVFCIPPAVSNQYDTGLPNPSIDAQRLAFESLYSTICNLKPFPPGDAAPGGAPAGTASVRQNLRQLAAASRRLEEEGGLLMRMVTESLTSCSDDWAYHGRALAGWRALGNGEVMPGLDADLLADRIKALGAFRVVAQSLRDCEAERPEHLRKLLGASPLTLDQQQSALSHISDALRVPLVLACGDAELAYISAASDFTAFLLNTAETWHMEDETLVFRSNKDLEAARPVRARLDAAEENLAAAVSALQRPPPRPD